MGQYKEYMIWWISFSKFPYVLSAFTYEIVVGNFWSNRLGVNVSNAFPFLDCV